MATRLPGQWPPVTSTRQPADFIADDVGTGTPGEPGFVPGTDNARRVCRGTVEYSPAWANYSLHTVDFQLAGASLTITDANFAYARLKIRGAGSITFRGCNLVAARWRVFDGATLQFIGCNAARGASE